MVPLSPEGHRMSMASNLWLERPHYGAVAVITKRVRAHRSGCACLNHRIFGPTDCDVSALPHRAKITSAPTSAFKSSISARARVSTPYRTPQ